MGWNPNIKLFKCNTCKKTYNNRLTHVCKIPFSKAGQRKIASKQKPKQK